MINYGLKDRVALNRVNIMKLKKRKIKYSAIFGIC